MLVTKYHGKCLMMFVCKRVVTKSRERPKSQGTVFQIQQATLVFFQSATDTDPGMLDVSNERKKCGKFKHTFLMV